MLTIWVDDKYSSTTSPHPHPCQQSPLPPVTCEICAAAAAAAYSSLSSHAPRLREDQSRESCAALWLDSAHLIIITVAILLVLLAVIVFVARVVAGAVDLEVEVVREFSRTTAPQATSYRTLWPTKNTTQLQRHHSRLRVLAAASTVRTLARGRPEARLTPVSHRHSDVIAYPCTMKAVLR